MESNNNQELGVELSQRKRVMTQHLLNKAQTELTDAKPTAGNTLEPGAAPADNKRVSFMEPAAHTAYKMNQLELALAPIAINCLPIQLSANPLETLLAYIEQIKTNPQHPELVAIKYLKLFEKRKEYTIKTRDVRKLVPNINLKIERNLLKNFGIAEMNAIEITNQNEKLYSLKPYQYILAVMVNSASFDDFDKRIAFAFKMYDNNNDGQIDKKDLKDMLVTYAKEDQLRVGDAQIEELSESILEDMSHGKDYATVDDFKIFLNQYSRKDVKIGVFDKQNARISYVNPNQAALAVKKNKSKLGKTWKRLKIKIFLNYIKYMWVTIWLAVSIFLFQNNYFPSKNKTGLITAGIARGCAGCINFNSAILLLLASKSFNTLLRFFRLTFLMPLDLAVSFHKTVGKFLFFWSSLHSIMHIFWNLPTIADLPLEAINTIFLTKMDQTHSVWWWLFMSLPGSTGLAAWFFMTLLIVCTIRRIRKKDYEAFWYSHKLWIPIVALTAWHGTGKFLAAPQFAYWLVFPSAVILFDMSVTIVLLLRRPRRIRNLAFLESGVIELKLTKPDNYHFTCGQYCLINIPRISKWQWHPFSISSSKRDPYMTFHISPAGDWTNSLKKLAQELKNQSSSIMPAVYVQGPYGAPSQVYDNYKHLICITTGVGATPFASILRNLNQKAQELGKDIKSASVDFYWVNRRPSSHTWLNGLLQDLQNDEKSKSIVNVNIFLTSLHAKYDLRSLLLYRGISILNAKGKTVKGLDHFNVIHWGRPNWGQIFQKKGVDYPKGTRVGVFFCGNKDMGAKLFECTQKYSGQVVFDFHREVF